MCNKNKNSIQKSHKRGVMVRTSQRKKLFVFLLPLYPRKYLTVPVKSESVFTRNAAYFICLVCLIMGKLQFISVFSENICVCGQTWY